MFLCILIPRLKDGSGMRLIQRMVWNNTTAAGDSKWVITKLDIVMCFSQQLLWSRSVTQTSNTHYRPGRHRKSMATTDYYLNMMLELMKTAGTNFSRLYKFVGT